MDDAYHLVRPRLRWCDLLLVDFRLGGTLFANARWGDATSCSDAFKIHAATATFKHRWRLFPLDSAGVRVAYAEGTPPFSLQSRTAAGTQATDERRDLQSNPNRSHSANSNGLFRTAEALNRAPQ